MYLRMQKNGWSISPYYVFLSFLSGYDLPKGNPFATNSIEDPGLRKQIFNASFEDLGDYVVESGISARAYKMCDTEFKNRVATNMKGYEKVGNESELNRRLFPSFSGEGSSVMK